MVQRRIDLLNLRFGRLLVIGQAPFLSAGNTRWICLCDCGNKTIAQSGALRGGRNNSCGCLQKETATKHGMEGSGIYKTWSSMKSRCLNVKHMSYKDYGGRGITICDRWMSFEMFFADMGNKPKGLSLDRIDNNLGYSKENCRWATVTMQNNNRRNTAYLEYQGVQRTRMSLAKEYNISEISLKSRLNLGWDIHKALTTPIDKRKSVKKCKT